MAFNKKDRRDFIFHDALVEASPAKITVDSKWRDVSDNPKLSKARNGLVDITIAGQPRTYWCINDECAAFFTDEMVGQHVTLVATGTSYKDASLALMGSGAQLQQPRPAAQPQRQAAPAQRPASAPPAAAKWQPLGATVGMAVNNACQNLTHRGQPLDPNEVYEIASDLLRVATRLEKGTLAPSYSERHAPAEEPKTTKPKAAPAPEPEPEQVCQKCASPLAPNGECPKCNDADDSVPF